MTRSVEEQMADIERRMKQLRARKQRIVARENAKARKRRTHLIIRLGGILSNEGVLGYDEGVWNDEGNRQRLLDMLKAHAAELRAWASDAGVRVIENGVVAVSAVTPLLPGLAGLRGLVGSLYSR